MRERERPKEGVFFYHCSISRGKGHDHFHREEKEKTQVDQEKRAKRTGRQSQGASLCR